MNYNWVIEFNKLFGAINKQGDPMYFSGSRFIDTVRVFDPKFYDYNQYTACRNTNGLSTSRKSYFYDILMKFEENVRKQIIQRIWEEVELSKLETSSGEPDEGCYTFDRVVVNQNQQPNVKYQELLQRPEMFTNPTAFISYAWEDDGIKDWVRNLATQLRSQGIDAKLDQWEVVPGDRLPHFMERSVRENDYILLICTQKYKMKSENRLGGVGYEGDIMTGEVLQNSNHLKFIPILQSGAKETSIPSWLQGKYYIDLSSTLNFQKNFEDLTTTLLNTREVAPKLGEIPKKLSQKNLNADDRSGSDDETIRIKGILVDEVTQPSDDGTQGSALYRIPFELSRQPNYEWSEMFTDAWNRPSSFTSMHRPGIASITTNKIILDGTTIEEVERCHKETLKLAVDTANKNYKEYSQRKKQKEEDDSKRKEEHKRNIDDISRRISFD